MTSSERFTFTPGKEPGQWQELAHGFVLRCPSCGNRFRIEAWHFLGEPEGSITTQSLVCPHPGCTFHAGGVIQDSHENRRHILADLRDVPSGVSRHGD